MATRLEMQGLNELRAQLRALPDDLAREAGVIVEAQAVLAQQQIQQAYPEGPTGNLRHGVTISKDSNSRFGTSAIVRSRAKHASIYERGTKPRRTVKGANRGQMPQPDASRRMIPIVIRRRRVMVEALKALVRKAGLIVEGD